MNITTDQLKLFNTCPLLLEQYTLYQRETLVSRSIQDGILSTIFLVLYQKMKGRRPSQKSITDSWKATCKKIQSDFPGIPRDSFDFPAQCLAVFLEHYLPKSKNDEIIAINSPFSVPLGEYTIQDNFQVLTKTPYGTRIKIFEFNPVSVPPLWIENNTFYSIPYLGYEHEFSKKPLSIDIHNLATGSQYELVRKSATLDEHRNLLASILDLCYNKYRFPNNEKCATCKISSQCHTKRYI